MICSTKEQFQKLTMWPFRKSITSQQLSAMVSWSGGGSGFTVSSETALRIVDVYSCVRVLCGTISSLPINLLYRDGKRGYATSSRLYRLLHKQPNAWQTASEFQAMLVQHVALSGNFFAHINRTLGEVRELNPLHPSSVVVTQKEDLTLEYEVRQKDGSTRLLQQGEMLHVRGLVSDGVVGQNVVRLLAETFGQAAEGEKYQGRTLRNGAKPSGILTFPDKLTDEQYKKEKARIEAAAGGDNAGGTLMLDRAATFLKVSLSGADIQLLDTMKLKRSQIAGALGVPAHLINDLDRATFSNIEHMDLAYYKHSISHWLRQIELCLDRDILTEREKDVLQSKFNPNALLRGDLLSRMDAHTKSIMIGMRSPNEGRALEDLPPREDGYGDQYFYPANLMPAELKPQQSQQSKGIGYENENS